MLLARSMKAESVSEWMNGWMLTGRNSQHRPGTPSTHLYAVASLATILTASVRYSTSVTPFSVIAVLLLPLQSSDLATFFLKWVLLHERLGTSYLRCAKSTDKSAIVSDYQFLTASFDFVLLYIIVFSLPSVFSFLTKFVHFGNPCVIL